jgi:hypothetical protein
MRTIEEDQNIGLAEKAEKDIRFNITWCESNIRYLAGGEQNEETKRLIEKNEAAIEKLKGDLIIAKQDLIFLRGF